MHDQQPLEEFRVSVAMIPLIDSAFARRVLISLSEQGLLCGESKADGQNVITSIDVKRGTTKEDVLKALTEVIPDLGSELTDAVEQSLVLDDRGAMVIQFRFELETSAVVFAEWSNKMLRHECLEG